TTLYLASTPFRARDGRVQLAPRCAQRPDCRDRHELPRPYPPPTTLPGLPESHPCLPRPGFLKPEADTLGAGNHRQSAEGTRRTAFPPAKLVRLDGGHCSKPSRP